MLNDLNGDGYVDEDDYQILISSWSDPGTNPDPPPQPSCDGYCGDQHPDGCFCDEACCIAGDCCDDKFEECGGCEP